jgi:hypothetical protein
MLAGNANCKKGIRILGFIVDYERSKLWRFEWRRLERGLHLERHDCLLHYVGGIGCIFCWQTTIKQNERSRYKRVLEGWGRKILDLQSVPKKSWPGSGMLWWFSNINQTLSDILRTASMHCIQYPVHKT